MPLPFQRKYIPVASGSSGPANTYANTQSISLDGVNQCITASLAAELHSFGIWFKPNAAIDKSSAAEWLLGISEVWGGISLGFITGSVSNEIVMMLPADGGSTFRDYYAHASESISAAWHHLMVDWDGSHYKIWLDGVDKWNASTGTPALVTSEAMEIGRRRILPDGAHYFHGLVNSFYAFSAGQGSEKIASLYNSGTPEDPRNVDESNLIGWWACEEGSGTTVSDDSTNSNDATLTNGPTWSVDTP